MTLPDFLDLAARTPFQDGQHDCLLWPASWVRLRRGYDPARAYRDRYTSWRGGQTILTREGGLLAVVTRCMAAGGIGVTESPVAGDVGLLPIIGRRGPALAGAICTGPRWAVLAAPGLWIGEAHPVKAWRI